MSAQPTIAVGPFNTATVIPRYGSPKKPLGDPAPLACTVAKAALEIVMGGEGLETLVRWVGTEVRDALAIQQSLARRAGLTGAVARVERARVCRVSQRAAEVSIVASAQGRARAIAMRLEDVQGRWMATTVEII